MNKILRSIGVVAAFTVVAGANAQTPDYDVWPAGVVMTDIGGGTHDIDAYLDAGQSVLIDAFADWCPPCWDYHQGGDGPGGAEGVLEQLYQSKGDGGTGEVKIFSVEADPGEPEANITDPATGMGDWSNTSGTTGSILYPLVDDDNIAGIINLGYYPTLILICPDRTVTEIGQVSLGSWEAAVGSCGTVSSNANDPRILTSMTATSINVCGATTGSTDAIVVIQNYSTSAISGAYDIEITQGATVVASTTVTLNLAPYAVQEVNVGSIPLVSGTNNFIATITTPNDNTSNDALGFPVVLSDAQQVDVNITFDINIVLDIDAYPTEVGFALREGNPASNDPGAVWSSSNSGNSVVYQGLGSITGAYNQNFTLSTTGCHYIVFYDDYGDGITYSYPSGHAEINGVTSMTIPGSWGDGTIVGVKFAAPNAVQENDVLDFLSIYPNPAIEMTNVKIELNDNVNVSVDVINTLGQVVFSNNLGEVTGTQIVEINTSDLQEGIYLVNITVGNDIITERISVVK